MSKEEIRKLRAEFEAVLYQGYEEAYQMLELERRKYDDLKAIYEELLAFTIKHLRGQ